MSQEVVQMKKECEEKVNDKWKWVCEDEMECWGEMDGG